MGAVVLSALAWLITDSAEVKAACGPGTSVVVTSPSLTSTNSLTPLSGVVTLRAHSTPAAASSLAFILVSSAQKPLGEATRVGTEWTLSWDTRNQANGPYQLLALARYGSTTSLDCASAATPIHIHNSPTQTPRLVAALTLPTWQGTPGQTATVRVEALSVDQYGRQARVNPATVRWQSALGRIEASTNDSAIFTAGLVLGTGLIAADITHNSQAARAIAGVKVVATSPRPAITGTPVTDSPRPATSPPATPEVQALSAAEASRLAAMPTIFRPTAPTNSNPVVALPTLGCLERAVGAARFSEISNGRGVPTAPERQRAASCFSGSEPIPAILAPIMPAQIADVEVASNLVSIAGIKNQTITNKDGKKISGLYLSGQGAPNSVVFLYVFSDPLVLRAETDRQGVWNYVLETPLTAGQHEIYAVTAKDATFVRTPAAPITIATMAPNNPHGGLIVERPWSTAQLSLATLAALMVLAAIGLLVSMLRRRRP